MVIVFLPSQGLIPCEPRVDRGRAVVGQSTYGSCKPLGLTLDGLTVIFGWVIGWIGGMEVAVD